MPHATQGGPTAGAAVLLVAGVELELVEVGGTADGNGVLLALAEAPLAWGACMELELAEGTSSSPGAGLRPPPGVREACPRTRLN